MSDWTIFNEIFVEDIYDHAITYVLSNSHRPRCCSYSISGRMLVLRPTIFAMVFQSDHPDRPFFIHCAEGSPQVYADLTARVAANPRLKGHIKTWHGLVGKRSGSTDMYESSFGAGNSTVPNIGPSRQTYRSLIWILYLGEPIALLKCDIEGCEQTFQDHYHDLLGRTQGAVVELHHGYIHSDKFHQGMTTLGFSEPMFCGIANRSETLWFYIDVEWNKN